MREKTRNLFFLGEGGIRKVRKFRKYHVKGLIIYLQSLNNRTLELYNCKQRIYKKNFLSIEIFFRVKHYSGASYVILMGFCLYNKF